MKKKISLFILKFFLAGILLFAVFFALVYYGVFGHIYTKEELKDFKNETASVVLSDSGEIIGKFFAENRTNIEFADFPKHLVNALISTEDARYFEHGGVDSKSLLRVLFKSILLQQKNAGGGSTLTQQLAKNMYGRSRYGPLTMPINKLKEIILANRLEKIHSKEEILTLYLNTVPFGENVLGIESAARRYFNKSTKELRVEEAAVLVGLLKANTYYNPRLYPDHALKRRNIVLNQMQKYDYLSQNEIDSIKKNPIKLDYANLESEGPANYFLVQVKKEVEQILKDINKSSNTSYQIKKSGLIIETTLNSSLQKYALNAFKSHLGKMQKRINKQYKSGSSKRELQKQLNKKLNQLKLEKGIDTKKNRELFSWDGIYTDSITIRDSIKQDLLLLHAGLIAVNPNNGEIKAWVGGIDYRIHPYDQIFAQRQTASAFKPILYYTALQNGAMPCQYLDNDEIVLTDFDNWSPQNYNHSFGGKYSLAASLAFSMNIPTVNLFLQVPFNDLQQVWKTLGFSQTLEYNPSTALGATTASLYEMVFAYARFANGGKHIKPVIISSIKNAKGDIIYKKEKTQNKDIQLNSNAIILLNEILQKTIREGTGKQLANTYGIHLPLAGKTGTSQNYADAWFLAYNPNLVMATRVGASLPAIHFNNGANGSGSKLALPIIAKTLQQVQKNKTLKRHYFKPFDKLPEVYLHSLDCEDFIETSEIENFFESIFKNKNTTFEKASKKASRKAKRKNKSFFKRIFGKKE